MSALVRHLSKICLAHVTAMAKASQKAAMEGGLSLAVLLGKKVSLMTYLLRSEGDIPLLPPEIVALTPIDALQQRPDIQASERRLAQSTALSAAAFAGYFPKLSLEGFFGTAESSAYGGSSPWSVTFNALLPLLNFGRIESQVDIAEAQEKQAFYRFKQTVLLAVEEVEVSFYGYLRETEREGMFFEIAQEQSEAAQVAREQYLNGIAPQLDLLNAEQNALNAETNYILSKMQAADNLVRLYTALGYGSKRIDTQLHSVEPRSAKEKSAISSKISKSKPIILPEGADPNAF